MYVRPSLPCTWLWKIRTPTLPVHTGPVKYNQCVGAFELEAFEQLPMVVYGGQWEPGGLNQTGWWTKTINRKRLRAVVIHSPRSAALITLFTFIWFSVDSEDIAEWRLTFQAKDIFIWHCIIYYYIRDSIKDVEIFSSYWAHLQD